jgi:hypothetical protein
MEKKIFKAGDRVFDIVWGWGVVTSRTGRHIEVKFESDIYQAFTHDGKYKTDSKPTLSFTEYTLQGFSQERPVILPEVGELCLVKDYKTDSWLVRVFAEYKHGLFICKEVDGEDEVKWNYIKRIKILD